MSVPATFVPSPAESPNPNRRRLARIFHFRYWSRRLGLISAIAAAILLPLSSCHRPAAQSTPSAATTLGSSEPEEAEAAPEQVQHFCTACHAFPPPDSFPRYTWRGQVMQAYFFYERSNYDSPELRSLGAVPPAGKVIKYFENRAPEELRRLPPEPPLG